MTGLAMGVAANNQRESGIEAQQFIENGGHAGPPSQEGAPNSIRPSPNSQQRLYDPGFASSLPRGGTPILQGQQGPSRLNTSDNGSVGSHRSQDRFVGGEFGNHYTNTPHVWDPRVSQTGLAGGIDPNGIADDPDEGLTYGTQDPRRKSVLSLGRQSAHSSPAGVGGPTRSGAAAGGVLGALGGFIGRNRNSTNATPEPSSSAYGLVNAAGEPAGLDGGNEKSEWLNQQTTGNKKMKWIVGIIIGLVVAAAVAGGIVGGVLGSRKNSSSSGSSSGNDSPPGSPDVGGDLNKNSAEIKKLMNNPNLHKVFPGMDYTPLNAATYPDCLTVPPDQNNVTMDIAVLSQLTNTIRLYGTDCNQTEMVLHSIKALGVDMKVWLGVWQDNNATTNDRQLAHMYSLLDTYGTDPFVGVIVGNEVLFRKDMTESALIQIIGNVRSNFSTKGYKLPLATADLGDNWDSTLAQAVDVVMSNVHPFFAGVTASAAAGWSWDFWQGHNVDLTAGLTTKPQYIISEIGWPSAGGNDCGVGVTCPDSTSGSVAGVSEMNTFLDSFVCQSLKNATTYFW
jgi:exo-beta-1,3-glucanase (GH17 family)